MLIYTIWVKEKRTSAHNFFIILVIIYNNCINSFKPSLDVTDNISVTKHVLSENLVIHIISDNGLVPNGRQAITWYKILIWKGGFAPSRGWCDSIFDNVSGEGLAPIESAPSGP